MKLLASAFALTGLCASAFLLTPTPASALETYEARMQASDAASQARLDMMDAFGPKASSPGNMCGATFPRPPDLSEWSSACRTSSLISIAATRSSPRRRFRPARTSKPTPTGIFSVLDKKPMYRSKKYDNAPMPFMQRIDQYGVALHAGYNPGEPASHGCIRLPAAFAKKLYAVTDLGTPVIIGA